jgi:uncharacterized protein YndB with AHSA1/START domain
MSELHHEIVIAAPVQAVWSVLADLEAVRLYNPAVAEVRREGPEGIGAIRHCIVKPKGWMRERVIGWEPLRLIELEMIDSSWPVVSMHWKTVLHAEGRNTRVTQDFSYRFKLGRLGALLDTLFMRRKMSEGMQQMFAALKRHVEGTGQRVGSQTLVTG